MKKVMLFFALGLVGACYCTGGSPEESCVEECNAAFDPVRVLSHEVKDSILELEVEYGGGCKDHLFELWWDGNLTIDQSDPNANFRLQHDGQNDQCKQLIRDTLMFRVENVFRSNQATGVDVQILPGGEGELLLGAEPLVSINIKRPETEDYSIQAMPIRRGCSSSTLDQ